MCMYRDIFMYFMLTGLKGLCTKLFSNGRYYPDAETAGNTEGDSNPLVWKSTH